MKDIEPLKEEKDEIIGIKQFYTNILMAADSTEREKEMCIVGLRLCKAAARLRDFIASDDVEIRIKGNINA